MTKLETLKNKYPLILEEDFGDALYNGCYGGTVYYFDADDAILTYCYYSNQLSYMGESHTSKYNKEELLKDIEQYNYSYFIYIFRFADGETVKKILENIGVDCDKRFANDPYYKPYYTIA